MVAEGCGVVMLCLEWSRGQPASSLLQAGQSHESPDLELSITEKIGYKIFLRSDLENCWDVSNILMEIKFTAVCFLEKKMYLDPSYAVI